MLRNYHDLTMYHIFNPSILGSQIIAELFDKGGEFTLEHPNQNHASA